MTTRQPCAPHFYSGDCKRQIDSFLRGFVPQAGPSRVVAGIVPHAGWFFSGATAAMVFRSIQARQTPDTFVIFGAVHVPGVRTNCVFPAGEWETPLGPVQVDSDLAAKLLGELPGITVDNPAAHSFEHSIEVQVPIIKHLFPKARIVPIAVPPREGAAGFGRRVGQILKTEAKNTVVIGSTDLTHYGDDYGFSPLGRGQAAYEWMLENDRRIIDLAISLDADEVLPEAARNHNACGPGAMAATVAAAKELGAPRGILLRHTTSYDVYPGGTFEMAVGYAGIIF